jgi:UDP-N-acetylglucosamine acyltransferase
MEGLGPTAPRERRSDPAIVPLGPVVAGSAVVEEGASIADGVRIGPGCHVSSRAVIGRGTTLEANVVILGEVRLGEGNRLHAGCVIGGEPQDTSYRGGRTRVVVGNRNVIREGVTINRGTEKEDGETVVGDDCLLMACSHVAHDCRVGDHVTLANGVLLGGHVRVHSHASLSGCVAVHHWATVGSCSFVAGLSRVLHDVPPFMLCDGSPARARCINTVGLRRKGFSPEEIEALGEAHRLLYRARVGLEPARELLGAKGLLLAPVTEVLDFLDSQKRGVKGRARERRRVA